MMISRLFYHSATAAAGTNGLAYSAGTFLASIKELMTWLPGGGATSDRSLETRSSSLTTEYWGKAAEI
jgi:hypothetical protein